MSVISNNPYGNIEIIDSGPYGQVIKNRYTPYELVRLQKIISVVSIAIGAMLLLIGIVLFDTGVKNEPYQPPPFQHGGLIP